MTPPRPEALLQQRIRWTISSDPPGAELFSEELEALGRTPWRTERVKSAATLAVKVTLMGYEPAVVQLNASADQDVHVKLHKAEAGPGPDADRERNPRPKYPRPPRPESLGRQSLTSLRRGCARPGREALLDCLILGKRLRATGDEEGGRQSFIKACQDGAGLRAACVQLGQPKIY